MIWRLGENVGRFPLGGDLSATRTAARLLVATLFSARKSRRKLVQAQDLPIDYQIPEPDVGDSNPLARFDMIPGERYLEYLLAPGRAAPNAKLGGIH